MYLGYRYLRYIDSGRFLIVSCPLSPLSCLDAMLFNPNPPTFIVPKSRHSSLLSALQFFPHLWWFYVTEDIPRLVTVLATELGARHLQPHRARQLQKESCWGSRCLYLFFLSYSIQHFQGNIFSQEIFQWISYFSDFQGAHCHHIQFLIFKAIICSIYLSVQMLFLLFSRCSCSTTLLPSSKSR